MKVLWMVVWIDLCVYNPTHSPVHQKLEHYMESELGGIVAGRATIKQGGLESRPLCCTGVTNK